ncbi:MAG: hypothetical protein Q8L08_09000, partial [Candidatus Nanopelagicaceae bacterium]|nr:hypothetical protein [Candidatus Nanopelagicaceae bacterium]
SGLAIGISTPMIGASVILSSSAPLGRLEAYALSHHILPRRKNRHAAPGCRIAIFLTLAGEWTRAFSVRAS